MGLIRVLVADDSGFMRASLSQLLSSDSDIEVIGAAVDGEDALKKVSELRPDVVLLDINMPRMDGLTALTYIMAKYPTPVVILSGLAERDARIAIKSLERGAVDFIPKPSGVISYDIDKIKDEIIAKVKIAAEADVKRLIPQPRAKPFLHKWREPKNRELVIIGASTGGPRAVKVVLSGIPQSIPAAILIVQHMSPVFIPSFAERLHWESSLDVSVAKDKDTIAPGRVFIAPGNRDILFEAVDDIKRVLVEQEPASHPHIIDRTMESAAKIYREKVLAVLLTGVGSDGAEGMRAIKKAGGATIAEDESTAIVYGMPKAAIEIGVVDETAPLPRIAEAIMRMI